MRAGLALLVIASILALSVATQANAAPVQSISLEPKQPEPFAHRLMKILGFVNEAGAAESASDVKKPDAAPLPTAAELKVPAAAGQTAPPAAASKPSELSQDASSTAPVQKEAVITPGQKPSSSDSSKPAEQQKPASAADSKPAAIKEPVPAAKVDQPAAKVDAPPAKVDKPAAAEPKPQDKPSAVPEQKPVAAQPKPQEKPAAQEDKPAAQQPTAAQLPTATQVPTANKPADVPEQKPVAAQPEPQEKPAAQENKPAAQQPTATQVPIARPPQVKQVPSGSGDSPFMLDPKPPGAKKPVAGSVPYAGKRSGSDSPFMIDVLMPPKQRYIENEYRGASSYPKTEYDAQYDPKYDDEAYYPKVMVMVTHVVG